MSEQACTGGQVALEATDSRLDSRQTHEWGPWSVKWLGDEVSAVNWNGHPVLDSVRPAVRDQNWNTIEATIVTEVHDSGLVMKLIYACQDGEAAGGFEIHASEKQLRLSYWFTPAHSFLTNRVGLTAMLPLSMVGDDLDVTDPHGSVRRVRLPRTVSPWQPVFDIARLDTVGPGMKLGIEFSGDVFEMEDQRNWTDASFKIYSRPLRDPFPYVIAKGETVRQQIVLTVTSDAETSDPSALRGQGDQPRWRRVTLPCIGVGMTTEYAARLRQGEGFAAHDLGVEHVFLELSPRYGVAPVIESALDEVRATRLPLHVQLIVSSPDQIRPMLQQLGAVGLTPESLGVVDESTHVTTSELLGTLQRDVSEVWPERKPGLVAGARTHFAEFNRQAHSIPKAPIVRFSVTPQMHMRESWHVLANTTAIVPVMESAHALFPQSKVWVGPVTLRPRVNSVATEVDTVDRGDEQGYGAHLVEGSTDPRHGSAWEGAWMASTLAGCALGGAKVVTASELSGSRGITYHDENGDLQVTTAGKVLRFFAQSAGKEADIAIDCDGRCAAICGNQVLLSNPSSEPWRVEELPGGMHSSLNVEPGVIRIESLNS